MIYSGQEPSTIDSDSAPALAAGLVVLAGSTAMILGAWVFELFGGLPPCPLCLKQRWAYYAGIPLLAASCLLLWRGASLKVGAWLLGLGAVALLAGALVAAYHAGVEWKLWQGPQTCGDVDLLKNLNSVLPDLDNAPLVRCDEAPWRLFGLSLAGYNFLISLALGGFAMMSAMKALSRS